MRTCKVELNWNRLSVVISMTLTNGFKLRRNLMRLLTSCIGRGRHLRDAHWNCVKEYQTGQEIRQVLCIAFCIHYSVSANNWRDVSNRRSCTKLIPFELTVIYRGVIRNNWPKKKCVSHCRKTNAVRSCCCGLVSNFAQNLAVDNGR